MKAQMETMLELLEAKRRRRGILRFFLLSGLGLIFFILFGWYLMVLRASTEQERFGACFALEPELLDMPAPTFTLKDLNGKKHRLEDYRGKVVFLNFWATWCPPCVEELPSLDALFRTADPRTFTILTVSVDDSAEVVKRFFSQHRRVAIHLPVLMDSSRNVPAAFGTKKFPESYIIDGQGNVRFRFINKRDWSQPESLQCLQSLVDD